MRGLLHKDMPWMLIPMPKNTTGPTFYTVNGRSVSKTILGKPYTGHYDGKLIIHWPPHKNLPNGAKWTKLTNLPMEIKQGMIKSLIVLQ